MLYCPQCGAEYREGFSSCSDCHVLLVHEKPSKHQESLNDSDALSPALSGTIVTLWEGENLALYESLFEKLDQANIRYYSQPLGVYPGVRRGDSFPIQPLARFGYHVGVLSSQIVAARDILEKLLDEEPEDMELSESAKSASSSLERAERIQEKPTTKLWTAEDQSFASFLDAALSENDIHFRTETHGSGKEFYVCPSDESRAREIIREILEATPPE